MEVVSGKEEFLRRELPGQWCHPSSSWRRRDGAFPHTSRQARGLQPQDQSRKQCQRERWDPEECEEGLTEQLRRDYSLCFYPIPNS